MGGESFVWFEESTSLKWRLSTWPVVASQMLLEFCCCRLCLFLTEAPDDGRGEERRGRKRMGRVGTLATDCPQGCDRSAGITMTPRGIRDVRKWSLLRSARFDEQ